MLFSVSAWLFSLFSLLLPPDAESSDWPLTVTLGGARQRGISHAVPVKLLMLKPPLAHLRQGAPERSSARRPALMAPWFALGPSLWAAAAPAPLGPELGLSAVPSSLGGKLVNCFVMELCLGE